MLSCSADIVHNYTSLSMSSSTSVASLYSICDSFIGDGMMNMIPNSPRTHRNFMCFSVCLMIPTSTPFRHQCIIGLHVEERHKQTTNKLLPSQPILSRESNTITNLSNNMKTISIVRTY